MFVYSPNDQLALHISVSYDMKLKGDLCDVTVKVEDQSFPAHRIILASAIPYFRAMFTSGMVEANQKEIYLKNGDPKVVEALINYAYGKTIRIERSDVLHLLLTSDFMEMKEVRDACQEFLLEGGGLDPENVVSVLKIADGINQQCLIDGSLLYIRNHFEDLSKGHYLLDLPYEYFAKIVGSNTLDVANEEAVFEIVIKWVKASPLERHSLLPELLNEIRMTQLPQKFLHDRVGSETLIMSSIRCQELVEDIKKYHVSNGKTVLPTGSKPMPRKLLKDRTLYIIAKNDSGCRTHHYSLHLAGKNAWHNLGSSSGVWDNKVLYVAVVDQKIYVFLSKTIQIFHLRKEEWEVLHSAEQWIHGAAIVLHRNIIYGFGSIERAFQRSVHRFDSQHNKWNKYGAMAMGRSCSAAASLDEFIYIIGGTRSNTQKYNPLNGMWEKIAPMPVFFFDRTCTGVNGKLYVFGLAESDYRLEIKSRGLVYDPKTGRWSFIAPINVITPYRFSLVPSSNGIHAIVTVTRCSCTCACTGCIKVCELHRYDVENDEWDSRILQTDTGSNEHHDLSLAVCS